MEEVTVVTAAFGSPSSVMRWASSWLELNVRCIVCDNGGVIPNDIPREVRVLPFSENSGFGGGINRCVDAADTPLVLVTNPDTVPCSPDSLNSLVRMHRPGSFSSGALLDAKGHVVPSGGIWPTVRWLKKQVFGKTRSLWRDERIDWIQGALILCLKEDFLSLQGFSPDYPLYFEDVDLCARASSKGMTMNYQKKSLFYHIQGTGSSGSDDVRIAGYHWGASRFFRHHAGESFPEARRLILAKCLLRCFLFLPNRVRASGYLKSFSSVLRGVPPSLPARCCHGTE